MPGAFPLSEDLTLARLLASIGLGPRDRKATLTVIRYSETNVERWQFNVADVVLGKEGRDFTLQAGDVYSVDTESEVYYVVGEVNGPGAFVYQKDLTVREAIILAGWVTRRGNLNKISVMRKVGREWQEQDIGLAEKLLPGDVIKVPERWF
jgi:polysaccharide export outer membrane protein